MKFTLAVLAALSFTPIAFAPIAAQASNNVYTNCGIDRGSWTGNTADCQNPNFPQGTR